MEATAWPKIEFLDQGDSYPERFLVFSSRIQSSLIREEPVAYSLFSITIPSFLTSPVALCARYLNGYCAVYYVHVDLAHESRAEYLV